MLQRAEELHGVELLLVGGGNTFQLLRECRSRGFLEPLKREISLGCKYVGWSAGSNLACPSIKTTNDMPIVDPGGLEALGLPEGDWLRVSGGRTELRGPHDAVWFCAEKCLSVKPGSLEAA